MKISVIVATSKNWVIGKDNKLPWHLPADLKYFKSITMSHCILMGRKTYESIGKPLPGRTNIVITRNKDYNLNNGTIICSSLEEAYNYAGSVKETEAFVIGGAEIIKEALQTADKIYLTSIDENFEGDTFLNPIDYNVWKEIKRTSYSKDEVNPYSFSFVELERLS